MSKSAILDPSQDVSTSKIKLLTASTNRTLSRASIAMKSTPDIDGLKMERTRILPDVSFDTSDDELSVLILDVQTKIVADILCEVLSSAVTTNEY